MGSALDITRLVLGIGLLYWGAEWLVRGSARLARSFSVKPLVLGLTIVAYGTSAPELAVSTKAALGHAQPIALGTVIGACAANISLILGLTALISPPVIDGRIIRREVPILLGSAIAVPVLLRDGVLSRVEGLILIGCAVLFTIATLTVAASSTDLDDPEGEGVRRPDQADEAAAPSRIWAILMTLGGLVLLVTGADAFVGGARGIAADVGMSERMLGITVIALGCSVPELATSVVAALRGQSALAIGSVIGSNLLNVFLVLGVVAYLRPISVREVHLSDLFGLIGITLLGVLMLRGSRRISRFEGLILVLAYVGFVIAAALL